jgi:Domain of unknown function (DUF4410)
MKGSHMKWCPLSFPPLWVWSALAGVAILSGCASTGDQSSAPPSPNKFTADDGRIIDIGKSYPSEGGTRYDDPHMEKGKCWVADGFDFNGYDTLYIAPTLSTAKFNEKNEEEVMVHKLAKEHLVSELVLKLNERKLFPNVVTKESDIKLGAKTLKLENTITEFTKGGGAARYFVGLYGGGQPVLRVQGKMADGDKTVFTFEARRSGTSAGSRLGGVFMKDQDIQIEDIRSLVLDLTDFMAAVAKKYPPKT